jgi:methionyl-tRNA formyltransferase
MITYVVASSKDWFKKHPKSDEYNDLNLIEISDKKDLNLTFLEQVCPRYIFFPHWNWKVDSQIYERFECVVFHTAPLPFGRGGSPIQNLILNGLKTSPVCALKMTDILDGGPIYDSIEISLDGTISDIFSRIAVCIEKLIMSICHNNPAPVVQSGKVLTFKRLSSFDNELLCTHSISELYDRIRMVDGEHYPRAYIKFGTHKIEFSSAATLGEELHATVRIYRDDS